MEGTPAPFGFTGELQDSTNGLVYLRARWYQPGTARFTGRDPFAGVDTIPYSLHPYQYGYSNPVSNTDPSGRFVSIRNTIGEGSSIGAIFFDTGLTSQSIRICSDRPLGQSSISAAQANEIYPKGQITYLNMPEKAFGFPTGFPQWTPAKKAKIDTAQQRYIRQMGRNAFLKTVTGGGKYPLVLMLRSKGTHSATASDPARSNALFGINGLVIEFWEYAFDEPKRGPWWAESTAVHEFAHSWDQGHGLSLSRKMVEEIGGIKTGEHSPAYPNPAVLEASPEEDWGENVAAVLVPEYPGWSIGGVSYLDLDAKALRPAGKIGRRAYVSKMFFEYGQKYR